MIDRKITNDELVQKGLVVDGVEIIPPLTATALAQLRYKRSVPYYKIAGRVYYQQSELIKWVEDKKTGAA